MVTERVATNTASLIVAFVGQKLLSFLYFTVVARAVGVEGAGKYFLAVSFTTLFSIFADLGLSNVLVREVAKRKGRAQELLSNVLGIKVLLIALTAAAVLASSAVLGYAAETSAMIAIAAGVMALDTVHLAMYAAMRGFQNLRTEAIGVVSGQAATIAAGLLFIGLGLPLPFLVVALLFGSAWNVIWSSWALRKRFGLAPSLRFDPAVFRFFLGIAAPFALAGIFARVYSSIDSVILSKLASDTEVGLYGVAYKIAFAFQFLPMAVAAAAYPAMSEYYVSDRVRLRVVFEKATLALLLIGAPLAAGTAILARPFVVSVYGPDFAGAALPLAMLMGALLFAFLYWPAGSLLNACDRQKKNTAAMGATMAVNIALNFLLVPAHGRNGAAAAALVGNALLCLLAFRAALVVSGTALGPLAASAGRIFLAAGIMSAFVFALSGAVNPFLLAVAGAGLYAVTAIAVRAVTKAEIREFVSVFMRPRAKAVSDITPS